MKSDTHNNRNRSSIGNKIMFKVFALTLIVCMFIISNNAIKARNNDNKFAKVDNSVVSNNNLVHSKNQIIKLGNLEYSINSVEHQKDTNNPLLGKDSEYIIITMKVKNNGSKTEAFDAFDMILQADIKGEKKNIRNISDTTIYNIPSGVESNIKLVYIIPNDSTDIHIISEKNNKINLEVEY